VELKDRVADRMRLKDLLLRDINEQKGIMSALTFKIADSKDLVAAVRKDLADLNYKIETYSKKIQDYEELHRLEKDASRRNGYSEKIKELCREQENYQRMRDVVSIKYKKASSEFDGLVNELEGTEAAVRNEERQLANIII
jgi:uncharacterized coiled-coil DUF342 family protein